jgi:hypothetical protein
MNVGHEFGSVSRTGNSVVARMCDTLSGISAFLAAILSFIARRSERMATRLERIARWLHSKATGVPLGVDVAGEDWEEPVLLPLAPEPPPIPPAAFFRVTPPEQDEEWAAALAAAKQKTPEPEPRSEPEPSEAEWEAALLAAKKEHEAPAAKPAPKPAETKIKAARPAAPSKVGELRAGPKAPIPRAVQPHISLKPATIARESTPKPIIPANPKAAATRDAVAAALRS